MSFTAALLYAEGMHQPTAIRNRILASVDFDSELGDVASSGRLNVLKAISIREDVVTFLGADGKPGPPQFGMLDPSQKWTLCGETLGPADLEKLIPHSGAGPSSMRVFVRRLRNNVDMKECMRPQISVRFTALDPALPSQSHPLETIYDIVTALPTGSGQ